MIEQENYSISLSQKMVFFFIYTFKKVWKKKTKNSRENGKIREPVGLEIFVIFRELSVKKNYKKTVIADKKCS